jgi:hypothetical protein
MAVPSSIRLGRKKVSCFEKHSSLLLKSEVTKKSFIIQTTDCEQFCVNVIKHFPLSLKVEKSKLERFHAGAYLVEPLTVHNLLVGSWPH